MRELARARANPRVGATIADALGLLVEHAQALPYTLRQQVEQRHRQRPPFHDELAAGTMQVLCKRRIA